MPIGGLMADEPVEVVDEKLEHMKKISTELGISKDIDAFMTLAFISLPVMTRLWESWPMLVATAPLFKPYFPKNPSPT